MSIDGPQGPIQARAGARGGIRLALAGDTMLGRGVGEVIRRRSPRGLVAAEVLEAAREADLVVLNLECSISECGAPRPGRKFHFRAPPAAVETLAELGVDCVSAANNHALDFGPDALLDTLAHLAAAGIARAGAGPDEERARAPAFLEARGRRLAVLAFTDHPPEYAAGAGRPGVAYADLSEGELPGWVPAAIAAAREGADALLVLPHWGPNMGAAPVPSVARSGPALLRAGADLVAGHSAHVFHGVSGPILWDLGDFLDDYALDPWLRNDLGLLWLVDLDEAGPARLEALPLKLEYAHTRLALGPDADWIRRRLRAACAELGTGVAEERGRLVVALR